jgi:hypothetical protein
MLYLVKDLINVISASIFGVLLWKNKLVNIQKVIEMQVLLHHLLQEAVPNASMGRFGICSNNHPS